MSIERQPSPRNWCNCVRTILKLRRELREAKEARNEKHEALVVNEIGAIDYAHETGRCRFEYDRDEQPMEPAGAD